MSVIFPAPRQSGRCSDLPHPLRPHGRRIDQRPGAGMVPNTYLTFFLTNTVTGPRDATTDGWRPFICFPKFDKFEPLSASQAIPSRSASCWKKRRVIMFHMKTRTICVRGHTLLRGTSLTFTGTSHRGQDLSLDRPRTSHTKTYTKWSGGKNCL